MRLTIIAAIIGLLVIAFFIQMVSKESLENQKENLESEEAILEKVKSGEYKEMVLAGGCFWCTEAAFEGLPGVINVVSGYTGGDVENPTYAQVSSGTTGHYEAVKITYDVSNTSYEKLLDQFWRNIDPTDNLGQFVDKGTQYRTAIFYNDENEKEIALKSKKELEDSGKVEGEIVTEVLPLKEFYLAEEYHQDYSKKNLVQYKIYEQGSGRKQKLKELWE